jgi:hypothetical protein
VVTYYVSSTVLLCYVARKICLEIKEYIFGGVIFGLHSSRRKQSTRPKVGNALCQIRDYAVWFIQCPFHQCVDAVEAFVKRKLTVQADALWAFSGVTKAFEPQFPGGFIWGMPIDHLDAALQ